MKKFLAIALLGFSSVFAQTVQTTPNLITSGTSHTWTGVTTGTIPSGCATAGPCPGGPSPIYDPSTNTVSFSYNASAYVGQAIAINNALAGVGAGVKVNGYNYAYEVRNMNGDNRQSGIDTFTVATALRGANNSTLLSHNQYFNTKFEWTAYSGTKTATTPYNLSDVTYLQIGITGGDNGYWGGYFGPQIRNVNMSLNYTVDPCATNPAYSPTCAGYSATTTQNVFSGMTGPQAYAINNALTGSGVTVHGFNYGYDYNVGGRYCNWLDIFGGCLGTWIYPTASVTTTVSDSGGALVWNETNTHTAGEVGSFNKQMRFGASRPITTLGSFSMTPSGNISNMYSTIVYTPDPCVVDPLSSQSCPGYQQALLNQQCPANPLYDSACPGYAAAVFAQNCNADQLYHPSCPGYAAAYLVYQCGLDPLYSPSCSGYEAAYFSQQCTADPLYSNQCPGYERAYFNQQCLRNSLYSNQCEGYATAYAIKYIVKMDPVITTAVNQQLTEIVETQKNDPVAAATNTTAAPTTTSATSVSPVAVVSVVKPSPAATTTTAVATQPETKKDSGNATQSSDSKSEDKPKTAKEALAERRQEAAKKEAVAKARDLAGQLGSATSMEAQKAVQNVVIQAMGFTPGFDQYGKSVIPDTQFYRPYSVYGNQKNVDTRNGNRLFGGTDRVHQQLIESQYQLGN